MEKNPTSLLLRWEGNRNFPYPRRVSLISETLIFFLLFIHPYSNVAQNYWRGREKGEERFYSL